MQKGMAEKIAIISSSGEGRELEELVPVEVLDAARDDIQRAIPAQAKDSCMVQAIERAIKRVQTRHQLIRGDSRRMEEIADESVHLVVTSPPYWTLKQYPDREGQLGLVRDYEELLENLNQVWKHAFRVLVRGGRMVVVVGDVCLPRRHFGRHVVYPHHASIQEHCRKIGFDNLAPIIWHKIANAQFESKRCTNFLGKPYEPNAIIKNNIEYILFQRKPGGYRQPTSAARLMSVIPENCQRLWFQQIWEMNGASTRQHPASYPMSLAERLIRMFSFVGDTVLDPFMGKGTTNFAAGLWGRNSIGFEIEPTYFDMACGRIKAIKETQLTLDSINSMEVKPPCAV